MKPTFMLVIILQLAPLAALHAADRFWDEIPVSSSNTLPQEVLDNYWNSQFQRINREVAAAKDCKLVFFGDSITWSWSLGPATGKAIWEKQFAHYKPINMGNSGDITPVMLHRVTRGNLEFPVGQHPKVAVLLCGVNNFGVTQSAGGKEKWDLGINCPPEDIANSQRAIAQVFRRKLPSTRIIMMGLLPVADRAKWEKCKQVNAIQAKIKMDFDDVAFINLQDSFVLADGSINSSLYTDGLHLTEEGYRTWEKGISTKIDEFMKAPPFNPVKIMLIGGSATEGPDSSRAYRRYLDGMLRRKGHHIDFVGSRHKHNNNKSAPDSYQFDPDHEGHPGKNVAWFVENMTQLLEQNNPDFAVIELGTLEHQITDAVLKDLSRLVDSLRAKNPQVKILIANTAPEEAKKEAMSLLSQKIVSSGQSSVTVTDIPWEAGPKDQFPNEKEAQNIAASLADAISPLLPSKNLPKPK